jgi:hypothetical protein
MWLGDDRTTKGTDRSELAISPTQGLLHGFVIAGVWFSRGRFVGDEPDPLGALMVGFQPLAPFLPRAGMKRVLRGLSSR